MEFIDIHVIETKYWTMQYKVQWNKLNSILRLKIYSEPLRLRSFFTTCWARQKFSTFLWAITQFEELHVYTCSCASFGLWEISIARRTQFLSCFDHFQGKMGAIPFKIKKTGSIGKLKSAFIHVIVYVKMHQHLTRFEFCFWYFFLHLKTYIFDTLYSLYSFFHIHVQYWYTLYVRINVKDFEFL